MKPYFLYAEDDGDDIAVFKDAMDTEANPDNTVYVNNGFELFNYLQEVKTNETYPCLIILDFHLPRVNGLETLVLLKTDDLYRLIPVIVFSSKLTTADEEKCKSLGADVIKKPVKYNKWPETITRFRAYFD